MNQNSVVYGVKLRGHYVIFGAIFLCCMQLFEDIFHNCIVSPPHTRFFSSIIYFKPIKTIEYTCSLMKRLKFVSDLKDVTFFYYTLLQADLQNCCFFLCTEIFVAASGSTMRFFQANCCVACA